mgnify:CR=1 FL=1
MIEEKNHNCSIGMIPTKCARIFLGKWYKPWTWFIKISCFHWAVNYGWKIEQGYINYISIDQQDNDNAKSSS